MQIDAEPPQAFGAIRRIRNSRLRIFLPRMRRQRRKYRVLDFIAAQRPVADRNQRTLQSDRRRGMRHQQQIAAMLRDQLFQP